VAFTPVLGLIKLGPLEVASAQLQRWVVPTERRFADAWIKLCSQLTRWPMV
jgi:hypothetical protein